MNYILGIETSCDDTCMGLISEDGNILFNGKISQDHIHEKYQGIFPQEASKAHVNSISNLFNNLLTTCNIEIKDISIIGVTIGSGLIGSLLIGLGFAHGLSAQYSIKLVYCDHIDSHILVNFLIKPPVFPFISLVISGGHTHLTLWKSLKNKQLIGKTLDDAIGECLDKCGRILNIPYPGGPNIEKISNNNINPFLKMPFPLQTQHNQNKFNFSFSGLKTHIKTISTKYDQITIASSLQHHMAVILSKTLMRVCQYYKINTIVCGGGVCANQYIHKYLLGTLIDCEIIWPSKELSTDNGIMICASIKNKSYNFNRVPYSTKNIL